MQNDLFLIINSGSSTLKFALYHTQDLTQFGNGAVDGIGSRQSTLKIELNNSETKQISLPDVCHKEAVRALFKLLEELNLPQQRFAAVGHRIVHGGPNCHTATVIDASVIQEIQHASDLAPLHNPANLAGIEAVNEHFPNATQIAVFDTAFHHTLPPVAYTYPIPYHFYTDHGVRRYGFHGISHQYITEQALEKLNLPAADNQLLIAHMGNGCSSTAILNGKSCDTTMGLTPLEGAMMGTRSGDIDPGLHQYIHQCTGWDIDRITHMLNKESGLKGISGISHDVRQIQEAEKENHDLATLAINVYCFRHAKLLLSLCASLNRIDALIFTAGVGEHQPQIRHKIVERLNLLGLSIDCQKNDQNGLHSSGLISNPSSPPILVLNTDEQKKIAQECKRLVGV